MKVIRRSGQELLLEDRAWGLRFVGAGILATGLYGIASAGISLPGTVAAWGAIVGGVGLIIFSPVSTIHFDRTRGSVVLERRGVLGPAGHREMPLSAISTVDVEEERDSEGGKTYRIRLLLEDGPPLNLTEHTSPFVDRKNRVARLIHGWLSGHPE